MSAIDWTKPLRTAHSNTHYPVTVEHEDGGNRLISWMVPSCWSRPFRAIVTRSGDLIATLHAGYRIDGTPQFIENVPEEPKNFLHLYQFCDNGEWAVNSVGRGLSGQLQARDFWDRNCLHGKSGIIVEVPLK